MNEDRLPENFEVSIALRLRRDHKLSKSDTRRLLSQIYVHTPEISVNGATYRLDREYYLLDNRNEIVVRYERE
ncbi:MAG: hypothetical protein WC613_01780 [Candidatus Aenigmatarchaeota archaeon]